jgi:hypothetical protein
MDTQIIKNNSNKISYIKTHIGTILLHIALYGLLLVCAVFGSLANTICALITLGLVIYCDVKTRGAQWTR